MNEQLEERTHAGPLPELAPQFPVLDTLRAVGAIAVLTTHVAFQSGAYGRHGVWGVMLARLDVGVAIFFVLSGFLLSRPHLARAVRNAPPPSTPRYYWKRLLRIYPVYVVTVVVALALIPDNSEAGPVDWVRTLLLLDTYTDALLPHGLTQMWSLAVEVAFYLVLPGLMVLALGRRRHLRPRRVVAVLGLLVLVSLVWHAGVAVSLDEVLPGMPGAWLPAYLTWFAVGVALALAHVCSADADRVPSPVRLLRTLGSMPGTCWVFVAGLLLTASTPLAGPVLLEVGTQGEDLGKHLIYALIGGLVVLTGIWPQQGRYLDVAGATVPRHLGHISYSIFCIHLPVLTLVMAVTGFELFGGNGLTIWLLTLALSILAAEVLYVAVERPFMRLRGQRPRSHAPASQPSNAPTSRTTEY